MKAVLILTFIFVAAKSVESFDAKCKGIDIKITEEQMMSLKECGKTVGVETAKDFTAANAGCFSKCMMEKKNLIDATGKPHKENIMKAMDKGLPDELKDVWKAAMEKCLDNEGTKIMIPDDATCSSFLPLAMCVHMAFLNICK